MGFGAFQPFPRRFGRTRGQPLEVLTNSVLVQLGTAYDSGTGSKVWAKAHATARALWESWEQNRRMRLQFDPTRITTWLARWEAIYGITPPYGATDVARRQAIATRWQILGRSANYGGIVKTLQQLLPTTFVQIVHTPSYMAARRGPVSVIPGIGGHPAGGNVIPGTNPLGTVIPGFWSSTAHHVAIQVQQPANMLDADFYREVGAIYNGTLRRLLPAFVTFSAFRDGATGPGFFLDDPHNLDNERLLDVIWNVANVNSGAYTGRILPVYFSRAYTTPVYCSFYGFYNGSGPRSVTITLTAGTSPGVAGVLRSGQNSDGTVVGALVAGANVFPSLAVGFYTVEVSGNATSTIGVEPGTATLNIASP